MNKHELSRPSIRKILYICEQCLEHNSSWNEFKERVKETIDFEDELIKVLSKETKEK